MDEKLRHLLWGVTLISLSVLLYSTHMPLTRLCTALTYSQTMALIFVGEVASLLPFAGVVWKQWSISTLKEGIVFVTLTSLMSAYIGFTVYCSQHMPLGDFAALDTGSTMILVPVVTLLLHRRCIEVEDTVGIFVALGGVFCITRPSFIFGAKDELKAASPLAYVLAVLSGIPCSVPYFVIAYYPHHHWSTYLMLRTLSFGLLSIALLSITGGWAVSNIATQLDARPTWISITAALLAGPISNIFRVAMVVGCHEAEAVSTGTADWIDAPFSFVLELV